MKKLISQFLFWVMGWKSSKELSFPDKCIVITAPHTSNWDFLIGRCYAYISNISPKYLIKSELFFPIIGILLKINGGIPVYRKESFNVVDQVVEMFDKKDKFILGVAPEGTRKRVEKWKTGFYYMAKNANVPLVLVAMDYGKKEIGIVKIMNPSEEKKKDLQIIEEIFSNVIAKNPENYNSKIF